MVQSSGGHTCACRVHNTGFCLEVEPAGIFATEGNYHWAKSTPGFGGSQCCPKPLPAQLDERLTEKKLTTEGTEDHRGEISIQEAVPLFRKSAKGWGTRQRS